MEWTLVGKKLKEIDRSIINHIDIFNFKGFNLYPIFRTRVAYSIFRSSNNIIFNDDIEVINKDDLEYSLIKSDPNTYKKFISQNIIARLSNPQLDYRKNNKLSSNLVNILNTRGIKFNNVLIDKKDCNDIKELEENYSYLIISKIYFIKAIKYIIQDIFKIFLFIISIKKISNLLKISIKSVVGGFYRFYLDYLKYKIIYNHIECSHLCFLFASYGNEGEIMALKEKNCNISEYQHGILYSNHFGYNYDKCLISIREKFPIPDNFYIYDLWTKKSLLSNGFFDENQLNVVGNYKLLNTPSNLKNKNSLCIFSQIGYLENIKLSHGKLDDLLKSIGKNIEFIESIKIKLHPRERELPKALNLIEKEIEIADQTFTELINESEIILTCSPSIFYEAIALDKIVIYQDFQVSLNGTKLLKNNTKGGTFLYKNN